MAVKSGFDKVRTANLDPTKVTKQINVQVPHKIAHDGVLSRLSHDGKSPGHLTRC